jgi:carbonic anhydrase
MAFLSTRRFALICGVLAGFVLVVGALHAQQHAGPHWTYEGKEGPEHWGDLDKAFATCKLGKTQSPIDIRAPKAADLPPIQFAYQQTPLHIINNGHTIQLNYAAGSFITVGDKKFQLAQFHFHHPSEERVDGKSFAMVAHLVHTAADGSLAVVAVLLDPGPANSEITRAWEHLPVHEGPEQKFDDVQINVAGLLPKDHKYYTFTGSLTTPPCSENVTWFVLSTPTQISQSQADTFGKIYANDARPTQPLNGRTILMSK